MTAQRWFLSSPEQYERAPVGTEVWATWPDGRRLTLDGYHLVQTKGIDSVLPDRRREVKRWGTEADHARACAELAFWNLCLTAGRAAKRLWAV